MPLFPVIGAIKVFAAVAPVLAEAALSVVERMKNRPKPQPPELQDDIGELEINDFHAVVTNVRERLDALQEQFLAVDERLDALESVVESQAELIVQLTNHNATLARWVLILAIALAITSGVAIASLLLTIL